MPVTVIVASVAVVMVSVSVIMASVAVTVVSVSAIAIFSPMVTVAFIMAIANDCLVPAATISCIAGTYLGLVFPWIAFIYYYLIGMVPVEVVAWR